MVQRALIVGYGSIGSRHAKILVDLGLHVELVTKREVELFRVYSSLSEALSSMHPDYIVVSNETCHHYDALRTLNTFQYKGIVLVEKPLTSDLSDLSDLSDFGALTIQSLFVAYNMRFHPVIQRLKSLLEGRKILSVQAYVGQYLPHWRPGTDYRKSYSAFSEQGGGAIRDLSHELDYLLFMLGKWKRVVAVGGHFSDLEITSDDIYSLMIDFELCPIVTVQLNYLDRMSRRFLIVNTSENTIKVDVIQGTIEIDKASESIAGSTVDSYVEMHKEAICCGSNLATIYDGIEVLRLIGAAELSSKLGKWIER